MAALLVSVAECYKVFSYVYLSPHHNKIYWDTQRGQNLQVSLFRPHSYSVPLPSDVFPLFYGVLFSTLSIIPIVAKLFSAVEFLADCNQFHTGSLVRGKIADILTIPRLLFGDQQRR
jgi:hypothetical protein